MITFSTNARAPVVPAALAARSSSLVTLRHQAQVGPRKMSSTVVGWICLGLFGLSVLIGFLFYCRRTITDPCSTGVGRWLEARRTAAKARVAAETARAAKIAGKRRAVPAPEGLVVEQPVMIAVDPLEPSTSTAPAKIVLIPATTDSPSIQATNPSKTAQPDAGQHWLS
ncbi:uncharacterized protein BJ171DRAFT_508290 [Polychytrium aggregatum]|uniref:uncharacterized protein n=1 Tax=Polychytrium aggregatum TaxID=110093 RepID=UPI0022FF3DB7|nr:uncharacterized protein BJ171DRAFT_508290 [Polychytrium aggregatum]KAI9203839.1 hypothetical protein BJ171DRAFT_508290 [Polychytrium aggregatum]